MSNIVKHLRELAEPQVPDRDTTHLPTPAASSWGWMPALSLVSAYGLLLLALADNGGRTNAPWADLLFWMGLLPLFVPIAARLLFSQPSRRERIGLLVVLGEMLYLV